MERGRRRVPRELRRGIVSRDSVLDRPRSLVDCLVRGQGVEKWGAAECGGVGRKLAIAGDVLKCSMVQTCYHFGGRGAALEPQEPRGLYARVAMAKMVFPER